MAGPSKARQPIKLSDQPSYSEVRIAYSIVSQPSPEPDEATVPEPVVIKPLTQRFSIPKPSANPPIDTSSNISSKYQDSLATNVDLRRSANFTPSPLLDSFESNFDFGQEVSWTDGEVKYPELPVDPLADGAMAHPTLPSPNLEAVVTAKGKEKERRYSNGQDHTERPASTSVAKSRDTDTKIAATEAEIDKLKKQAIITAKEAEINRIEAKMKSRGLKLVKPGVLDEAHYRSEPVSRLPQIKKAADFLKEHNTTPEPPFFTASTNPHSTFNAQS